MLKNFMFLAFPLKVVPCVKVFKIVPLQVDCRPDPRVPRGHFYLWPTTPSSHWRRPTPSAILSTPSHHRRPHPCPPRCSPPFFSSHSSPTRIRSRLSSCSKSRTTPRASSLTTPATATSRTTKSSPSSRLI